MALINTDWEKELDQVERKLGSLPDEKVEPILDRAITKASAEMSAVVSQATYELQEVSNNLLREPRAERQEMAKAIRSLIRYAAVTTFILITASTVVIAQNY